MVRLPGGKRQSIIKKYEFMCRQGIVVPACTRFYEWLEEKEKNNEPRNGEAL